MSSIPISGYSLLSNGWIKNGSGFEKGEDVIMFDGVFWYLNGNKITEKDYPELIFKKQGVSFNPSVPIKK